MTSTIIKIGNATSWYKHQGTKYYHWNKIGEIVHGRNYNIAWGRKCNHGGIRNIKVEKYNVIKVENSSSK